MDVPSTTEMSTVLEAANATRRERATSPRLPRVTCYTLGALHIAGFVGKKRGTVLQFEKRWHLRTGLLGVTGRRACYGGGLPRLERPSCALQ